MTTSNELDRRLTEWLAAEAPPGAPDGLLAEVRERAAQTRRRPAWATPERWISMETRARLGAVPRTAVLLLVLISLLVIAAAVVFAAAERTPSPVPAPFGPARNGLIAYGSLGDIWVTDARGEQRRLTSGPALDTVAAWSRDGTWLAYWSIEFAGDPEDDAAVAAATRAGPSSLNVVRADGSEVRRLVSDVTWSSAECATDLSWSPDGSHIAFARRGGSAGMINRVEIVPVAGGEPRLLVDHAYSPAWSPDGTRIAYVNDLYLLDPDGHPGRLGRGISVIPASGGEPRPLSRAPGRRCAFDEPQWSQDGTRIAYQALEDAHDIYVADSDGSDEVAITIGDADESWPRWSPDDTRIAFQRTDASGDEGPRLVVTDPDGGNEVALVHPQLAGGYPVWSPDGSLLVGVAMDPVAGEPSGLALLDPTGKADPMIVDTGTVWGDPAWQRVGP
jgi:TolB protein